MILINLLPHRAEKRKRRKQAFFTALGASAVSGAMLAGLWYGFLQHLITEQEGRNQFLQAEIAKLDAEIKDIKTLRAEIEALQARQKAVEDLQADRNMPVHLLNELVRQTPEGVYLTSLRQDGQVVTLAGIAQSNERVSELLRNTSHHSEWLERPELIEIKATQFAVSQREQKRLYEFLVRVTLKKPGASAAEAANAKAAAQS